MIITIAGQKRMAVSNQSQNFSLVTNRVMQL